MAGRPIRFDRPGRPESPRVARPSCFERPKSSEKGARDAPRRDFQRILVDFRIDFGGFSRLHRASDSTRSAKGRTSIFADRCSTFKGSQTLQKKQKSTKIDEQSLRQCFANAQCGENSIVPLPDATWCRFWSPRCAPRRSRAPFLASRGILGDPPDAPAARRGRSGTPSRRSRDAFGTLLDATGCLERVPRTIFTRFWVPRGVSGDRFPIDFHGDFRSNLRASWPANG